MVWSYNIICEGQKFLLTDDESYITTYTERNK